MSLLPSADSPPPAHSHRRRRRRRSASTHRSDPHLGPAALPNHPLDTGIECLMVPLLAFAPLAYGSVEAWSKLIVYSLVALLSIVFCMKLLATRGVPIVRTWTYLPIVLYLAWVVLQLVPLSAALVRLGSPNTVALKKLLLADLPNASEVLQRFTLSFYPEGTRHDLRVVLAATAVFFVVVNTYRNPAQIRRLLLTIIGIGGAIAALAFAQDITHATHIFWGDRQGRGHATAGPFMTYSHYGQFMNLVIGAGLGMLLVEIHRNLPRSDDPVVSPPKPIFHRARRLTWLIVGLIFLEVATVFYSASRGTMLGLLIALAFGTAALSQTRGLEGRAWIALPAVLLLCASVVLFGPTTIFDRFMTLEHSDVAGDRLQIVKDLTLEFRQFPVTGTGLGTHEVIYPMYDHSKHLETATHAENEYAQAMEETGIVGVVLILIFALLVWSHAARATRNSDPPIRLAGIGLGVGLLAIEIHSFSDFGQHLLPNAILAATVCGLIVALSRQSQHQRGRQPSKRQAVSESPEHHHREDRPPGLWVLPARLIASAAVAGVCAWQLSGAYNAWRAEKHWNVALGMEQTLTGQYWDGSNDAYAALLTEAAAACFHAPQNVMYRYSLYAYRWHSITRVRDEFTNDINATPSTYDFARRICGDLRQARVLCPTYSHNFLLEGEIEFSLLNDPAGAEHIRTAAALGRNSQAAYGMAAHCDASEEKWDQSVEHFRRYLDLSGHFDAVVETYVYKYHKPDLAMQLAHGNVNNLKYLADCLDSVAPNLAVKSRDQAFETLKVQASRPDAPPDVLANAAVQFVERGQFAAAIKAYRRALAEEDSNARWHLALAKLLAHEDDFDNARVEVRRCLRINPEMTEARDFLGDLSVRRYGAATATTTTATTTTTAPATEPSLPATQPTGANAVSPETQPATTLPVLQ